MSPGPAKSFDPALALREARDTFWRDGYDGTGIRELEAALGVGRKSLYDTFGGKRDLYLAALRQYTDSVIQRICDGLERPQNDAVDNLERVLGRLARHHGSPDSLGCLLGVAMGQAAGDDEVAELLRSSLGRLESAFARCLRRARDEGDLRADVRPRDAARNLVALTQGMALLGRVQVGAARQRASVRAALAALRP